MKLTYTSTGENYDEETTWTITVEEETNTLGETLGQIRGEIAKSFWSDPDEFELRLEELRSQYNTLTENINCIKANIK